MESANSAQVILDIMNVQVFRLLEQNKNKTAEGNIKLCLIQSQNVHFITVDSFFQDLKKQMTFISVPFETQITYLIPHIEQGFFALVVSQADSNWEQLNNALVHLVTVISKESANGNEQINTSLFTHCPTVLTTSIIDQNKAAFILNQGGSIFKSGLSWFGSVVATSINKGGDYLSSKITQPKNVEVSQKTKGTVSTVKEKTKSAFDATSNLFGQVLKPVVEVTNQVTDDISEKIDKSDNSTMQYMKEVGKATMNFTSQAFDGLTSGLKDVGGAISNNTKSVVEQQFGSDVTTTFLGGSENNNSQQNLPAYQPMEENPNNAYPPINEIEISEVKKEKENLIPQN